MTCFLGLYDRTVKMFPFPAEDSFYHFPAPQLQVEGLKVNILQCSFISRLPAEGI